MNVLTYIHPDVRNFELGASNSNVGEACRPRMSLL